MPKRQTPPRVHIPTLLADSVKNKRAILFLGAGSSKEAKNPANQTPPDADQLRDILATRFFAQPMKGRDVMAVAEMAIANSAGTGLVFDAVRQAFESFQPSAAHRLISAFNWRAIATTNYDLLVEKAYSDSPQRLQTLIPFVKDDQPIEEKLQAALYPVPYLKLHGCLDHIHDPDIPLILSRETYTTYASNRTRLFGRLKDLARELTIIFVGYRLDDFHIRDLIYTIQSNRRPRWYIVTPDAEDYDVNYWATKNVEVLKCRFGEFMQGLDAAVPPLWRALPAVTDVAEFPVRKFFVTNTQESLFSASRSQPISPSSIPAWRTRTSSRNASTRATTPAGAALSGVTMSGEKRRKTSSIRSSSKMTNQPGRSSSSCAAPEAPAKRSRSNAPPSRRPPRPTPWCLRLEENGALRPHAFLELYELTKRPIYLFIDQMALHVDKLHALLKFAASRQLPLVVVGAERDADWGTYGGAVTEDFSPNSSVSPISPPPKSRVSSISSNATIVSAS